MKLLLFGDVHSSKSHLENIKKKGKNVDMLVCIGDISMFQMHLKQLLKELNNLGKPVLILPGNHEIEEDLEDACQDFKNIIYLHKDHYEIDEYLFFGYGSGGFAKSDPRFEKLSKKWEKLIQKNHKVILLTHGPPFGTSVDRIGSSHVGNKSYTNFIKKAHPLLAVCGHLHENFHKISRIGKTVVINPGPDGKIYPV